VFLGTFKSFKSFECECEELKSVCTQDGELIVIEWKVQQDATILYPLSPFPASAVSSSDYIGNGF
jgi:hypothetical protein